MYKTIIILVLVLGILSVGFLFARSCSNTQRLTEEIEGLRGDLTVYSDINQQLRDQNTELGESISRLRGQLDEYRRRITEARRIASELSSDTTEISGQLQRAIEQIREIRAGLKKLEEELEFE